MSSRGDEIGGAFDQGSRPASRWGIGHGEFENGEQEESDYPYNTNQQHLHLDDGVRRASRAEKLLMGGKTLTHHECGRSKQGLGIWDSKEEEGEERDRVCLITILGHETGLLQSKRRRPSDRKSVV